ncbi:MAG TPA: Wzz/FepE/Etk N-terminal domain-containing protein [Longimicrobium sp.]
MEKPAAPAREFRFLDLAAVVLRRWRVVALVALVATLAGAAAALLLPKYFVSATRLVPFAAAQSRTQQFPVGLPGGMASLFGGFTAASDRLVAVVLDSRTLSDSVRARVAGGDAARAAEVARVLDEGVRVARNPDGSVLIQVRAKDPRLAAAVANAYPPLLNALLARLNAEGATRKGSFLEAQVATARERLLRSEERLMSFQRDRGAPDVEEQASQTLGTAAVLQRAIYEQELEVARLRRSSTPDNPRLRQALDVLAARREQLRRLTAGGGAASVFVPVGEGVELKLASARLLRDLARDEQVYQSLTAALAEAQIDANNNLPVLSVLDPALPGGPVRSLKKTLALAAALGLLLGLVAAFAVEGVARLRENPANAEFLAAWERFRSELLPFGRRAERRAGVSMGD